MDTLLIFFAFPLAVIIISVILEKILRSPIAVAALIFAIFIIVTFAAFDVTFLIATLAYTILAFITAAIVHFLKCRHRREQDLYGLLSDFFRNNNCNNNGESDNESNEDEENDNENNNGCGCGCGRTAVERLINNSTGNSNYSNCNTNRYRR